MDRNTEAFLRRKKAGGTDRLAMRGPARVLIRHFLNVPRSHRHEYYLAYRKTDTARVKSKIWRANMGSRINKPDREAGGCEFVHKSRRELGYAPRPIGPALERAISSFTIRSR